MAFPFGPVSQFSDTNQNNSPWTPVIELSALNGTNGFKINGETLRDYSGFSVSSAGDINGDNLDDLLIGSPNADSNGYDSGKTYVVFGQNSDFPTELNLSDLDGSNGFKILGEAAYDFSGTSVSSAGDINGDNIDDLIIGSPNADPNGESSGKSYLVFGQNTPFDSTLELNSLNGTNGFVIQGEAEEHTSGHSVSSAGDINGDNIEDLIIGAPRAENNYDEHSSSGRSYVVFGKNSDFPTELNLSELDGSNGFQINGDGYHAHSGYSVSSAGDINGDNIDDLIIGAPQSGTSSGFAYVVLGKNSDFPTELNLSDLDGSNGFQINGGSDGERRGHSVSSAGDINGDGFDDLLIGAPKADSNGAFSGSIYVVFGKNSPFPAELQPSNLNGSNGFEIVGEGFARYSGASVSSAGDINGDGFADLLIGSPVIHSVHISGKDGGRSYVVFGKNSAFKYQLNLSELDGSNGFQINGEVAEDYAGSSVSSAGDINGDNIDDLIIGAPWADTNGESSGKSYVVFGKADDSTPPTETPDLSPQQYGFDIITEPQTAGNSVDVKFTVENKEAAKAGQFNVDFYLSKNNWISSDDKLLSSYTVENLQANGSFQNTTNLNLPETGDTFWSNGDGTYYIGMIIDGEKAIAETNEENNLNQGKFFDYDDVIIEKTGSSDLLPDLSSQQYGFDIITEPQTAGNNVDVLFTVNHTGGAKVDQFDVDFYLSTNYWISESDKLLGSQTINSLAGNSSFQDTINLTLPDVGSSFWSGDGTYYIGMIIDGNKSVLEVNETNNLNQGKFFDYDDVNITGVF